MSRVIASTTVSLDGYVTAPDDGPARGFAAGQDVSLGGGKRLFEGLDQDLDLDILDVVRSPYAVHARYAVTGRPGR